MSVDWRTVSIGTKVRYKDRTFSTKIKNGYFAGIFEPTGCVKVSKIDRDIEFTDTKMDDYRVCDYIKFHDVQLYE